MATGTRPTPRNLFSFSRVKTFHQCPRRYRYRYIEGLGEAFRSIESFVGQTVHAALEWLYGERAGGREPSVEDARAALLADWQRRWGDDVALVRVADTADRHRAEALEMLDRFFHGVFARDRSDTVALERRLSFAVTDDIHFTGVADRVGRTEAGRLFVVDYKTSRSLGDGGNFSEGLQAPLYAACVLARHEEPEAMAGYHYLRHATTSWHRIDPDRCGQVVARFRQLASEAMAATEFPASPGPLCAWCGFNAICPEARVPEHLAGGRQLALAVLTPGRGPSPRPEVTAADPDCANDTPGDDESD